MPRRHRQRPTSSPMTKQPISSNRKICAESNPFAEAKGLRNTECREGRAYRVGRSSAGRRSCAVGEDGRVTLAYIDRHEEARIIREEDKEICTTLILKVTAQQKMIPTEPRDEMKSKGKKERARD